MSWEFETEPEIQKDLDWMRDFMRSKVWPLEVIDVQDDAFKRILSRLQAEVKARSLWASHLPRELGGQGFGQVRLALMNEVVGTSFWGPWVFGCQAPDSGNSELLAVAGTPDQRERWLGPLLSGEITSAFSMTERDVAGSDPTRIQTRARLDGDQWVIDGHKWFTSNGMSADLLITMAVTDPDAEPHRRASLLLVPKDAPGLEIVRNIPTMAGEHRFDLGHAEVRYAGCRIPRENLLGAAGEGFALAQRRLGPGRLHHCMRWLGQASRAFDAMCEWAVQRHVGDRPLGELGVVRDWIAESAIEIRAARLLTLEAARTLDRDGASAARAEIAMAKVFGARALLNVIDRAIQVHGSHGYSGDLPLESMYRRARAARLVDGTDEVHKAALARQILRAQQAPPGPVPREHIPTRRANAALLFSDSRAEVPS